MLQEYSQLLTDQFFELVNFTGTKCVDKKKMFLLFLQKSLDPLRRENWNNFCEKIGVKICSQKIAHLLYGNLLDNFLQKRLQRKNKLCCKQVSVEAAEESHPISQDEEGKNSIYCWVHYLFIEKFDEREKISGRSSHKTGVIMLG